MPYAQRETLMGKVESLRPGRKLIVFFDFDRACDPVIPGITKQFNSDVKEPLFRILKETYSSGDATGIDLCLYTRGGETNAVWPIVSLIREFDPDFQVLVPFRCHSAGTLVALGSAKVVLTPLSELSPIDPSTGNQFNPIDESGKGRLGISVEDVKAYRSFTIDHLGLDPDCGCNKAVAMQPSLDRLTEKVHPLAIGNVHRVHQQIKKLAAALLGLHDLGVPSDSVINALTTEFYSHLHMINRDEATQILGEGRVEFASAELAAALDDLLYHYEDEFKLKETFYLLPYMGADTSKSDCFISGAVESRKWSYTYQTQVKLTQVSIVPTNVQVQLPAGQPMPLIPGLPISCNVQVTRQGWTREFPPKETR